MRSRPVATSQSLADASREAVATASESGVNATEYTVPVCPRRTATVWPVAVSQRRTVLSADPLAIRKPSGENATAQTFASCPRSTISLLALPRSSRVPLAPVGSVVPPAALFFPCALSREYIRTVASAEPVASLRPSAETATLVRTSAWPPNVAIESSREAARQSSSIGSWGPDEPASVRASSSRRVASAMLPRSRASATRCRFEKYNCLRALAASWLAASCLTSAICRCDSATRRCPSDRT